LRDEEILLIGSGNLFHNLHAYSCPSIGQCALNKSKEPIIAGAYEKFVDYKRNGLLSVRRANS
jgi:hypothetical protein